MKNALADRLEKQITQLTGAGKMRECHEQSDKK